MTRSFGHRAALLWLLTACGGELDQRPSTANDLATGGASGAASAEPPAVADAGQASTPAGGGAASLAGQAAAIAGAGVDEAEPRIGSGTRYCEDERYCFGLDCYAPEGVAPRACVAACSSDADCSSAEVCLESAHLAAGCYRRCDTPFDCDYRFDCFDFRNQQQLLVCFPTPWASLWQRERR